MLGDVAVAVNPEDARYTASLGKQLRLPLSAAAAHGGRTIPVIADSWANPEFGTGAVKVTPAHDPNDFAIGERHGLPQLSIMDAEARIDLPGSPYHGLDRMVARERIVDDLQAAGLLVAVEEHPMSIGVSQRTGAIVEPRLSTQWFLKIAPLAEKAIAAVEPGPNGEPPAIQFKPEQYRKTYLEWMRNIHDWCLSRQLWWGHRIPAWYCAACSAVMVARDSADRVQPVRQRRAHAGSRRARHVVLRRPAAIYCLWLACSHRRPRGLLPYAAARYRLRHPLLLGGAHGYVRLLVYGAGADRQAANAPGPAPWLNRSPSAEVYIHALVRDADRQKMSKTKGNVLDPITVVKQYGTDAVRFTLASMASPGTDIAFNEQRTEGYRAFANKIWNAARFIFMNVERAREAGVVVDPLTLPTATHSQEIEARWIRSQLAATAGEVNQALATYRYDDAANLVYQFFWGDFCDWYLEVVKLRLQFGEQADLGGAHTALATLLAVFEASLRLLSPFMPFLTEELWHALYSGAPPLASIGLAAFPTGEAPFGMDSAVRAAMAFVQELITAIRAARKELGVEEKAQVPVRVRAGAAFTATLAEAQPIIERLARISSITVVEAAPEGAGVRSAIGFDVQVVYEKQIDRAAERERLGKELARLEKEQSGAEAKLINESFLGKAPPAIIEGIRRRAAELRELIAKLRSALDGLASNEAE